jgi:hypothetical protein
MKTEYFMWREMNYRLLAEMAVVKAAALRSSLRGSGRGGAEDAEFAEKRDGNTEITEIGTQSSQREAEGKNGEQRGAPRSLHCAARRTRRRRERKVGPLRSLRLYSGQAG